MQLQELHNWIMVGVYWNAGLLLFLFILDIVVVAFYTRYALFIKNNENTKFDETLMIKNIKKYCKWNNFHKKFWFKRYLSTQVSFFVSLIFYFIIWIYTKDLKNHFDYPVIDFLWFKIGISIGIPIARMYLISTIFFIVKTYFIWKIIYLRCV